MPEENRSTGRKTLDLWKQVWTGNQMDVTVPGPGIEPGLSGRGPQREGSTTTLHAFPKTSAVKDQRKVSFDHCM